MEKKGEINIVNGEYLFGRVIDKKSSKTIMLKCDGVFYSTKLQKDKLVCSDKTITDKVEVWY